MSESVEFSKLFSLLGEDEQRKMISNIKLKLNHARVQELAEQIKANGLLTMPISEAVSNLSLVRMACGIEQKELSKRMGFKAASTISHWENGTRQLKADALKRYADALGMDVHIVFKVRECQ